MIKLFLHIRQAMIKANRVSKYLLYAIGEIGLVVIGIQTPSNCHDPKGCANSRKAQYDWI